MALDNPSLKFDVRSPLQPQKSKSIHLEPLRRFLSDSQQNPFLWDNYRCFGCRCCLTKSRVPSNLVPRLPCLLCSFLKALQHGGLQKVYVEHYMVGLGTWPMWANLLDGLLCSNYPTDRTFEGKTECMEVQTKPLCAFVLCSMIGNENSFLKKQVMSLGGFQKRFAQSMISNCSYWNEIW